MALKPSDTPILLVEDDPETARPIAARLSAGPYDVEWVDDGEKAFNRLDERLFGVLIAELNARRIDGMRLMRIALERSPETCVIFLAEPPDTGLALDAMHAGAYDYETKPVHVARLEAVVEKGVSRLRLLLERHELRRRLDDEYGFGSLVGQSRPMIKVYDAVRRAAASSAPILILGEAGTGKDQIAQAIHGNGVRRDFPFVKLDASAYVDETLGAELFGQGRGGASLRGGQRKQGRVELADGGTLFIDHAGSLASDIRERLSRLCREHIYERAGDTRSLSADVRVIAAETSPSAQGLESLSGFAALRIEAPALRRRPEDVPLLVDRFLSMIRTTAGGNIPGVTPNAMGLLQRYEWPGNIRELRTIIEGMAIAARPGRPLDIGDIPAHIRGSVRDDPGEIRLPAGVTMAEIERIVIEETMKTHGYNKPDCARTLGLGLRTLYRKLREYE